MNATVDLHSSDVHLLTSQIRQVPLFTSGRGLGLKKVGLVYIAACHRTASVKGLKKLPQE